MTRDTVRVVDDQDVDAEVFSALWAAAPSFPQLPPDAPPELQQLTVDVRDPKRVYAIYRASRRHNFQLLVERYITQLRFGCQDVQCNIRNCFTCRRRSAGSKPLRRYNATSARTLACFLASQDNPEKGLCQALTIVAPKSGSCHRVGVGVSSKGRVSIETNGNDGNRSKTAKRSSHHQIRSSINTAVSLSVRTKDSDSNSEDSKPRIRNENVVTMHEDTDDGPLRTILEQPVKMDHKSFVQNMFGTVAFRMIEWLTPTNLEALITSDTKRQDSSPPDHGTRSLDGTESADPVPDTLPENNTLPEGNYASRPYSPESTSMQPLQVDDTLCQHKAPTRIAVDAQTDTTSTDNNVQSRSLSQPQSRNRRSHGADESLHHHIPLPSTMHLNGSATMDTKDRDLSEHHMSRGGFTAQPLLSHENDVSKRLPVQIEGSVLPKKTRRRAPSTIKPKPFADQEEMSPYRGVSLSPTLLSPKYVTPSAILISEKDGKTILSNGQVNNTRKLTISGGTSAKVIHNLPQSLQYLNAEVIDLLCNILQEDTTFDLRSTNTDLPYHKEGSRNFHRHGDSELCTQSPIQQPIAITRLPNIGLEWRLFIEQSLFHVLSCPPALLESFTVIGQFLDTQSLWYCMTRLIQHFSPLIFDSLWISAADLYRPPQNVLPFLDVPGGAETKLALNNEKVSELMSLCLHALIAAVPYVHNSIDLFSISRIRSYGLSTSQGRRMSKDLAQVCLLYDDVFSNEMALRLARRVFASIPVRRQYQELLILNNKSEGFHSGTDVLDLVLAPLNFLDIEVPPILSFTAEERQLHEKRAPTLLIDWARTVMLKDWSGLPEVPADGSFGGALAMVQAIYTKRKSLLLGDVHFRTEYFADRLDSMEMPVEWLSFDRHLNKKTVHLLDYPYLFSPSTLVTYFRAINFSRMNRAFETSHITMNHIQSTMRADELILDSNRRQYLFDRLQTATSRFLVLQVRRTHVLVDAFNQLWRREERELSRPLKVRLGEDSGEEGSDSGGVQQEFFRLAIAEALDPEYGTFTVDERTRMTWFQPGSPEPLWKFELLGLIVSLAIYNGLTLPVTFPKALYRKLLGLPLTELYHIEDGWPDLANGLSMLLEWDEKDESVEDVFFRTYEFSVDSFGQQISRDMAVGTNWPQFNETRGDNSVDAKMVTSENRNEYVSDYIRWLTDISIRPQFQAFERGFFACLDVRSLGLFDHDILQSVVEGVQDIDISELRRYARYVGWQGDASHRTVKDFWSIVKKYGSEEKKKLLEFVTASDRLPVGGTRNLQFVVQRNGVGDIDGRLPTSYTCYGTLLLPEYSSKDVLREKLSMALENAKGFGFA